ncbi:MAG TPA: hypothetical protein DEP37_01440 [Algoriphagus sp.]|nr:hypothetical protein [Algoriphagus sp.]
MKGKLDFRIPHEKVIIDLKTSGSAHIDDVTHTFRRGRLAVQHAMYVDGVTAVTGESGWRFLFVFVETKKPYGIQIFELTEKTEKRARESYTNDIQVIIDWIDNAKIALEEQREMYTGYTTNIKVLDL